MRVQVRERAQPWLAGWQRLTVNKHSVSTWQPHPSPVVYRGSGYPENYATLYNDIHAAYQNALRYHISGDTTHGNAARNILNAWSATLTEVSGTSDKFLAAGIYGYQFANAAELIRDYPGFELTRFQEMMLRVFYPMNHSFLTTHNGAFITNYWANWDLCTMASVLAIGILCDDQAKVTEAVTYFETGAGWGSIKHAVQFLQPGGLGQWQESGRDQGHTMLGIGLLGTFCQMAWNQGHDLFGYDDNRFLKGCEYVAKYNLGHAVPFTPFTMLQGAPGKWSKDIHVTSVSPADRGNIRPVWELVYNHYARRRGLPAPWSAAFAAKVRPEGGGGDYGPDSGGYDQLGFGTLTFTV
jgi:Alginate lyase